MPAWILYALASMFFAGVTAVIAKFGMKNAPADIALAIRTTAVFVFVWVNAIAFRYTAQLTNFSKRDIFILCLSGFTAALSWIFYYRAIKAGNVSIVVSIDKASIVITVLLAFFFLKEPLTPKVILGIGLITAGTLVLVFQ